MVNEIFINNTKCLASKNQKEHKQTQCPCKRKSGTLFCGKHKNYIQKGYIRIDHLNNNNIGNNISNSESDENSSDCDDTYIDAKYFNKTYAQKSKRDLAIEQELYLRKAVKTDKNGKVIESNNSNKLIESEDIIRLIDPYMTFVSFMDYARNNKLIGIKKNVINKTFDKLKLYNGKKYTTEIKKKKISELYDSYLIGIINLDKVIKLQKFIKYFNKNKKYLIHGPAMFNRNLCNNETDFCTFDDLIDIPNDEFFSYKDNDNFIYGFHIDSIYRLIKEKKNSLNPYNREPIPNRIKDNVIKIHSIYKKKYSDKKDDLNKKNESINIQAKNIIISVMQKIDCLDFRTNINWIYEASVYKLRLLYKHLQLCWSYKAGLSQNLKRMIYPPTDENNGGDPFYDCKSFTSTKNKYEMMIYICASINRIVDSSEDISSKISGCIVSLMAINEINRECSAYNSWLN